MSHGVIVRGVLGGSLTVLLLGGLVAPAQADDLDVQSPASDADSAQWYAWADDAVEEAQATDWAALAAADGCTLVDVDVTEVVDPALNEALGAPEDMAVPVVEREEDCGVSLSSDQAFSSQQSTDSSTSTSASDGCSNVSGPGTLCIGRSGSYVTTSFTYRGSGSIKAFLKLYDGSLCGKDSALATGGSYSYSNGTRRSLSVYAPGYDGYTSHVWKYIGLGVYSDWGAACGTF